METGGIFAHEQHMSSKPQLSQLYRRLTWATIILIVIIVVGTLGYWLITDRQYSLIDSFYMTFITIRVGFGEIIDLSGNSGVGLFTIFISMAGIGVLAYVVTNITAFLVEGELKDSFRRKKMESKARDSKGHYIICGLGSVGFHVVSELHATGRPHVGIDTNGKNIEKIMESFKNEIILEGDATDNDVLLKAGITQARGLFAVTNDDNQNLVICLTARQLNPGLRIVARCNEPKNSEKMSRAGAGAIVSPASIGGMRIASEMIRPTVVSFLDIMLHDGDKNLRVEELAVPSSLVGKTLSVLQLKKHRQVLLLAVKTKEGWTYNPPEDYVIGTENTLIIMTDTEGRENLGKALRLDQV